MAEITFTIPDNKIGRVVAAMKGLFSIPSINVGTDLEPDYQPEFTDNQWAKESVRRYIIRCVQRWESKVAQDAAAVAPDEELAT